MPNDAENEIDELRKEIDRLDKVIIDAILERTKISKHIGKLRMSSGGTRLNHTREIAVLERFNVIGPEGHNLAMILLRLGRGQLGVIREEENDKTS